jgi:hypothetical protein
VSPGLKLNKKLSKKKKFKRSFNILSYNSPTLRTNQKTSKKEYLNNSKNIYADKTPIVSKSFKIGKFYTLKKELKKSKSQDWFSNWNKFNKIKNVKFHE